MSQPGFSEGNKPILCGMATGYPPFQYVLQNKESGIDVEVIKLVAAEGNLNILIKHGHWDDIVSLLRYSELDCVIGMEINELRKRYFDFSSPYYNRHTAIFIRADRNDITKVSDLYGKIITGDRHSLIENNWMDNRIRNSFRIKQTESKQDSMALLEKNLTSAAIMPLSVGFHLAKQLGLKVKVLEQSKRGTPVAIAVKKGNTELLKSINQSLNQLIRMGEIDRLYSSYTREPDTP